MSVVAIIAGAGSGTRFGSHGPKALVQLGGEPLVIHAVRSMAHSGVVARAVVTAPAPALDEFRQVLGDAGYTETGDFPVRVAAGGPTRQASVALGLEAAAAFASEPPRHVLIHDAARALTPPRMIARVVAALEVGHKAVVPALRVVDTVKEVGPANADGTEPITRTLERARLRAMQTPQGFEYETIVAAHRALAERGEQEASAAPDDATLMEEMGHEVVLVEGSERALKVTRPMDLRICEMLLADE